MAKPWASTKPARVRPWRPINNEVTMNGDSCCSPKTLSFFGILGAFLVVAALVYAMKYYTRPAPLNQTRVEERKKALAEIQAEDARALNSYEVIDAGKGLVRLKIDRAVELTIEDYKNPAAARTNLIARAEKASAPPPKAPEVPSKFE